MNSTKKILALSTAGAMLVFGIAGCKSSSNTAAPITNATDAGNDPAADGNLAPADSSQPTQVLGTSSAYTPQQQSESYQDQQAPAPQGSDNQYADQSQADEAAGEQAIDYTDQAPPPLPDYDQPPAPDPNYLWTPGYWAWGSGGYYWVPGAWCPPPYYGALWTPPYWGFYGGRYGFHRGYWGPHIGFYGGVDYGFGYIGIGFFGGYWHGHDFYYNRAVTNVGHVTNIYNRTVVYNNVHYGMQPANRVSYNGGRGGIDVRPRPAELAAMHEPHAAPLAVQAQIRQQAAQNRGNFYAANHGRPAEAAVARPIATAHIENTPHNVQQVQERSAQPQPHGAQPGAHIGPVQHMNEPQRGAPTPINQSHPEQGRTTSAPVEHGQPAQMNRPQPMQQSRPVEQSRPQPAQQSRPAEQPRQQAAPVQRSQPAPVERSAPASRPEQAPRPAPESRPAPAPRAAAPAPRAAAPAPRPAPASHPAPAGHEEHPR